MTKDTRNDIPQSIPPRDGTQCCKECFVVSHDVHRGFYDVAVPDSCGDEECECHSQKAERPTTSPPAEELHDGRRDGDAEPVEVGDLSERFDSEFVSIHDSVEKFGYTSLRENIKKFIQKEITAAEQRGYWDGIKVMNEEADRAIEKTRIAARAEGANAAVDYVENEWVKTAKVSGTRDAGGRPCIVVSKSVLEAARAITSKEKKV